MAWIGRNVHSKRSVHMAAFSLSRAMYITVATSHFRLELTPSEGPQDPSLVIYLQQGGCHETKVGM